jgi:N6-L-threonylcarbamoyladenine synthase
MTEVSRGALLTGPILGIETSCDDTAAAVVTPDGRVLSNIVASQLAVHERFGGVVPELAARTHLETLPLVVAQALSKADIDWNGVRALAVTQGPGLAGALLVGLTYAKALAYALDRPLIGVSHLEGHITSAWLGDPGFPRPAVVLVVSGGHTHLYRLHKDWSTVLLGHTLDDAAGEAFDKAAQMLGLGYPGGPAIDRLAQHGNPYAVRFARACIKRKDLHFSFSGLKTALLYHLQDRGGPCTDQETKDIAASFQEAVVDVLVKKSFDAVRSANVPALAVVGGVSANSRLRARLQSEAARRGVALALPPMQYCTDNAAMIALAGFITYNRGTWAQDPVDVKATLEV